MLLVERPKFLDKAEKALHMAWFTEHSVRMRSESQPEGLEVADHHLVLSEIYYSLSSATLDRSSHNSCLSILKNEISRAKLL